MNVICLKPEAAVRQLNVAIDLLFDSCDPLAVRTLASAAHGILADLVDWKCGHGSWREKIIKDSGMHRKAAIDSLNNAQNYLKHADRDPKSVLSFEETENDHVIFVATLECGEYGFPLSHRMQAFQIWYMAAYPENIENEIDLLKAAQLAFPGLTSLPRKEQLRCGREFLKTGEA